MYIHVKVKAGNKREELRVKSPTQFEIDVREPAKQNQANTRVLEILRAHFGHTKIRIINGHNSPSKLVSID